MADKSYGVEDVEIVRGDDDPPFSVDITETVDGVVEPVIVDGAVFHLSIRGHGVRFNLSSADGDLTLDAETGNVTWPYSEADSMKFPNGKPVSYALWRTLSGATRTFLIGTITGRDRPA